MARVLLTTLGTKKSLSCRYLLNGQKSSEVAYLQEALIELVCRNWDEKDCMVLFCSREAEKNNWRDRKDFGEGLQSRLASRKLNFAVKPVSIPDGKNPDEVDTVIKKILEACPQGTELYLDITHSSRIFPFLQSFLVNYLMLLGFVKLKGIFYASYDSVGGVEKLRKLSPKERIIPIIDLSRCAFLPDLAIAVRSSLFPEGFYKMPDAPDFWERGVAAADRIVKSILSGAVYFSADCDELLEVSEDDVIENFPFGPAFLFVRTQMMPFCSHENPVDRLLFMARWCLEHQLLPQAFVFARDFTLSAVCIFAGKHVTDFVFKRDTVEPLLFWASDKTPPCKVRIFLESYRLLLSGRVNLSSGRFKECFSEFVERAEELARERTLTAEQICLKTQCGPHLKSLANAYADFNRMGNLLLSSPYNAVHVQREFRESFNKLIQAVEDFRNLVK